MLPGALDAAHIARKNRIVMPQSKSKLRSTLLLLLKCSVVVFAFVFLIGSGKLTYQDLKSAFSTPDCIAIGIGLTIFPMLVSFLRYHYLLKALQIDLGIVEVTRLGFIGCFFNTFMPGGMGGDVVKVAYIMRDTGKRAPVIASAAVDRVLGMVGMLLLGGGVMLWSMEDILQTPSPDLHKLVVLVLSILTVCLYGGITGIVSLFRNRKWGLASWLVLLAATVWAVGALTGWKEFHPVQRPGETVPAELLLRSRMTLTLLGGLLAGLLCILIMPSLQPGRSLARFVTLRIPFGKKLMSFVHSLLAYRESPGIFVSATLLSLLTHGTNMLALYFFAKAAQLDHQPTVQDVFFAAPVAFIINSLPMPGGGLGVGEAAFDTLLGLCRTPEGAVITGGAAVFLIWRFWYIALGLIGLPLYLKGKKKIQEAEDEYRQHEHDDDLPEESRDARQS